jgi:hypothetical protein
VNPITRLDRSRREADRLPEFLDRLPHGNRSHRDFVAHVDLFASRYRTGTFKRESGSLGDLPRGDSDVVIRVQTNKRACSHEALSKERMKSPASYSFPSAAAMGTNLDHSSPTREAGFAMPFHVIGDGLPDLVADD